MRLICQRILSDITFMAEHNLMDYSLLLITEKNPEFPDDEDDCESFAGPVRYRSVKHVNHGS